MATQEDDVSGLGRAWEARNRSCFLEGYFARAEEAELLPSDPAARTAVLAAFELDKADLRGGLRASPPARLGGHPHPGRGRTDRDGPMTTPNEPTPAHPGPGHRRSSGRRSGPAPLRRARRPPSPPRPAPRAGQHRDPGLPARGRGRGRRPHRRGPGRHAPALRRRSVPGPPGRSRSRSYRLEVRYPDGRHLHCGRPLPVLAHPGRARPAPARRGPARGAVVQHGRPDADPSGGPGRELRGVGPQRPGRPGGGRLQLLGRPAQPHAPPGLLRHLGAVPARGGAGSPLQVRDRRRQRAAAPQGRPARLSPPRCRRGPPASSSSPPTAGATTTGCDRRKRADRARVPHEHLRVPPRVVADRARRGRPAADLPGPGRAAARLPGRPRLHPRRVHARGRAPLRRVVGLPGLGLLRPHRPLRDARTTSGTWSTGSTRPASA